MPRMTITEENRSREGGESFPRMKLKTGEKSRFILFEEPWSEFVHELKAPVIEGGCGVKEVRYRKDKTPYEVWKQEFIRRSICLGDPGVLADKGSDPANCPACKAASESGDVPKATQRFAANVIRYELQGNTWNVRKSPFGVTILVWQFTARMWDELITLQSKLGGELRDHDLTLDCEDGDWQRNKLSFEMTPAWQEAGQTGAQAIRDLLADPANRATDDQLRDACGSQATRAYMQEDVNLILRRWQQVNAAGAGTSAPVTVPAASLDGGLENLLESPGVPAGQSALTTAVAAELAGSPFAPGAPQDAQPVAQAAAAAQAADPFAALGANAPGTQQASPAQQSAPPAAAADPFAALAAGAPQTTAQAPAAATASPEPAEAPAELDFKTLLDMK